jgi:hypothetical protein
MLPIDEREAVERFADLKDFTIAVLAERGGFEAQHQREAQPAVPGWPFGHSHPPVLHRELVAAPRTSLMVPVEENHAVLHEVPRGRLPGVVVVLGWSGRLRERRTRESEQKNRADRSKGNEDPNLGECRHVL